MARQLTRIGVCSDTHNWTRPTAHVASEGNLQLLNQADDLQRLLLHELAHARLDMVLHLGDLTCGGGYYRQPRDDFYALEAQIRSAFSALPVPVYALPGNHDCPPDGGDYSYFEQLWGLQPGLGHTIDLPAARLVMVNAQGHTPGQIAAALPDDPVYGWVNAAELERVDAALASAAERPVVVFLHQLLRPWSTDHPWRDFFGVQNADAVLDVLARHGNVVAVIQGHAHRYDVQTAQLGGRLCHFVVTPAIIEYPVAWLELRLSADELRIVLRPLAAGEGVKLSRKSGGGQAWRRGLPAWRDLRIALR